VQELTIIRSDLQGQCDALHGELSEVTDANRDLQVRLDAANAALAQLKQDTDNRLRDAEDEIENTRYVARPHNTDRNNLHAVRCFLTF